MNESVDEWNEASTMVSTELESDPTGKGHDTVMENMESRDIAELLSQDEKDRVRQVQKLWDVVSVSESHEQVFLEFGFSVIVGSTFPCGESKLGVWDGNHEADSVQEDEKNIVCNHDPFKTEGFSILHHGRAPVLDKHVVHEEDGQQLPWTTVHEG